MKTELATLFSKYEAKFGSVRLQRPPQPNNSGRKVSSRNRLFGSATTPSHASASASAIPSPTLSELTSYLDSDLVTQFDESFNILSWWHDHKRIYPVLSMLAKDIMTVPVSTISSEAAFSLCGRLIEDRRRSLTPEHVEMCSLIKDWEEGDARQQHKMENKELEDKTVDMYLDGSGPEVPIATAAPGAGAPAAGGGG